MKNKVLPVLTIVHAVLITIAIALIKQDIVPIHWGITGEADIYGSKWIMLLFVFIPLVMQFTERVYHRRMQGNEKAASNKRLEQNTIAATTLLLIAVSWGALALVATETTNMGMVFPGVLVMLIGLLLMYVSNTLSTAKQNRWYGIKLPWTFKDETVWKKTHRFGAYAGMASGFLTLLGGALGLILSAPVVALASIGCGIIGIGVLPAIYAWRCYKKLHPNGEEV